MSESSLKGACDPPQVSVSASTEVSEAPSGIMATEQGDVDVGANLIVRSPSVKSGTASEYDAGLDNSDINAAAKFLATTQGASADHPVYPPRTSSARSVVDAVPGHLAIGSLRLNSDIVEEEDKDVEKKKLRRSNTLQRKANATLILTDFPRHLFLGLDAAAFTDLNKSSIRGVKGLPSGAHFLWGGMRPDSSRSGVWFFCGGKSANEVGEFFVRKWDDYNEVIIEEVSQAEIRNQKEEIQGNEDILMPYNKKMWGALSYFGGVGHPASPLHKIWYRMSSCISGEMLKRITGEEWNCWKVNSNDGAEFPQSGFGAHATHHQNLSFVMSRGDRTYSFNVIGEERTQQALDSSAYLLSIITENDHNGDILVGELQFAYATGMLVGNLRCMEQWATMVRVIFKAYKLSIKEPELFTKLIQTVQAQMTYDKDILEGSIFEHDPTLEDDLKLTLIKYKSQLNEKLMDASQFPSSLSPEQMALGKAFEDFEAYLCSWDWDLRGTYVRSGQQQLEDGTLVDVNLPELAAEDERGEFAPVICDENGQEVETLRHLENPW